MDEQDVVTGFLRNAGQVLLLQRSQAVDRARGRWEAISTQIDERQLTADQKPDTSETGGQESYPVEIVRQQINERTGIDPEDCELVRVGDPFVVSNPAFDRPFRVYPSLFASPKRTVTVGWEHADFEWTRPTAMLRRETVSGLWQSYDAIRPTVETVETDSEHGSAYISIRALEVLRDEAGLLTTVETSHQHSIGRFDSVEAVGRALLAARPAMTVVANRVNRTMQVASEGPAAVERKAHEEIKRAQSADERAAANLREWIDGNRVATLSRSGTVIQALRTGNPSAVLVSESRPGREGIDVAETLASTESVTLTNDAAFPHQIVSWDADIFVVGADAIFPDGTVRNKVGTYPAAVIASQADIPVVVVAATDKISPEKTGAMELRAGSELYEGTSPIRVANPTFDLTPPAVVDRFVTDRGELGAEEIRSLAAEHDERANWVQK